MSASTTEKRRHQVIKPIAARVPLFNSVFTLLPEQVAFMNFVRRELAASAQRIQDYMECNLDAAHYDAGRVISALDELLMVRDRLQVAVILPCSEASLQAQQ